MFTLFIVPLAISLLIVAPLAAAQAPIEQVSYTTGTQGAKLKWLPYRPGKPLLAPRPTERTATPEVVQAQAIAPSAGDPFSDPFDDQNAGSSSGRGLRTTQREAKAPGLLDEAPPRLPSERLKAQATLLPGSQQPSAASEMPKMEVDTLASARGHEKECPTLKDLKPINKITNEIAAEKGEFPPECPLGEGPFEPRAWAPSTFAWKASGVCHKPLYFEDVQLERYGHSWGPCLQPIISGGHFFLTVPALPYLMGLCPPCECEYTLGYYRPGSCAPYMLDPIPISVRAALAEGGIWTGMVYLIP